MVQISRPSYSKAAKNLTAPGMGHLLQCKAKDWPGTRGMTESRRREAGESGIDGGESGIDGDRCIYGDAEDRADDTSSYIVRTDSGYGAVNCLGPIIMALRA